MNMTKSKDKKTIFIVVGRSFIIRNVLRSGVLTELKNAGHKIVIFLSLKKGKDIPEYLIKEFCDEQVSIESAAPPLKKTFYSRLYNFFGRKASLLVYTDATWSYSQAGNIHNRQRMFLWKYVEKYIFSVLTHIHVLKSIVRFLEKSLFKTDVYATYFDKHNPDIVFTTSVIGTVDIAFMKEAADRGIKTISMTKGWDHAARVLYKFVPDKIIVQNTTMIDHLVKYQRIDRDRIVASGFPQFDWYAHNDLLMSRQEYLTSLGLDPNKKLVFFGSEGAWAPKDDVIAEMLSKYINNGSLVTPCSLVIRPHFSDIQGGRFNRFKQENNVHVDTMVTYTDAFYCSWDPGYDEIKHFVNLMYHSDVVVNIASTLTLDACCFNKPIVCVAFGVLHNLRNHKDVTKIYYEMNHYLDVLETDAIDLVKNEDELLKSINNYLEYPEHKNEQRKVLLDTLCYKVDGNSSRRIANEILSMMDSKK